MRLAAGRPVIFGMQERYSTVSNSTVYGKRKTVQYRYRYDRPTARSGAGPVLIVAERPDSTNQLHST